MKTLFIDTHLYDIHILLFNKSDLIRSKDIVDKKNNSTLLMPSIDNVLAGEIPNQIVVVNGPGSFTGVRLGVTVAKTLAYTLNIPIKVISSLDCMNISSESNDGIYAISDGNGVFIGIYQNQKLIENYFYLSNSEYEQYKEKNNVITNVAINYKKIIQYVHEIESINPHAVKPIYVKLIGVENAIQSNN